MVGRQVALSVAAVATVYAVGYLHTAPLAQRLASADAVTVGATASTAALPTATSTITTSATVVTVANQVGSPQRDERRGRSGDDRFGASAPTPTTVPSAAATTAAVRYRDGAYSGMGENRHGDVVVSVVISGGKITSAAIADCGMQYPCSRIAMLPGQVLSRQSTDVDLVSGATMSSTAYQDAVQQALAKAMA